VTGSTAQIITIEWREPSKLEDLIAELAVFPLDNKVEIKIDGNLDISAGKVV